MMHMFVPNQQYSSKTLATKTSYSVSICTSLNLANQNFHLPTYTSSTRTGILHWPNPDEERRRRHSTEQSASWKLNDMNMNKCRITCSSTEHHCMLTLW